MARTYKPKELVWFTCECGCQRSRWGRPQARHYEPYCRVRAFLQRRREEGLVHNTLS